MRPSPALTWLQTQWVIHPGAITAGVIAALALPRLLQLGLNSYRGYIALGKGGSPHNVVGWIIQGVIQLVARHDTITLKYFSAPAEKKRYGSLGQASYLPGPLPTRNGPRPIVPGYVIPQRQTTETATATTIAQMKAYFRQLVAANSDVLTIRASALEGVGSDALFLVKAPKAGAIASLKGETVHIHPEGSSHLTLSLTDAVEAVTKGWCERHRISGVFLPVTYLLVYAPRNEAEMEIWKELVLASVRFACAWNKEEIRAVE